VLTVVVAVLVNRDYRIVLDKAFYSSAAALPGNLALLLASMRTINRTETNPYDIRGDMTLAFPSTSVAFYDSPSSCLLRRAGLRLMQETNAANATVTTLEYRISDPYVVKDLDLYNPYAGFQRSEYIKRRYFFQQARSLSKSPAIAVNNVGDLAAFSPLPYPASSAALAKVSGLDLIMQRYGDVQIDFGSQVRKGQAAVFVWSVAGVPVHGEFAIQYPYWSDQSFTSLEITQLKLFYDAVTNVAAFVSTTVNRPADVLFDYVYPNASFCA